jgi:serine/threonine protein kinase
LAAYASHVRAAADAAPRLRAHRECARMLRGRMAAAHAAAAPLARRDTRDAAEALHALQLTLAEGAALVESWAKSDATALLAVIAATLAAPRAGAAFDAAREALCARITQLAAAAAAGNTPASAPASASASASAGADGTLLAALAADAAGWAVADAAAVRFDAAVLPSSMATLFEDGAALDAAMGTIGTSRAALQDGARRHGFSFSDVDRAMARAQAAAGAAHAALDAALDAALRADAERDAAAAQQQQQQQKPAAWARPEALLDARDVVLASAASAQAQATWRGAPVALLRVAPHAVVDAAAARALFREVARLAALPTSPHLARVHGALVAPAGPPRLTLVVERCEGVLLCGDANEMTLPAQKRCRSLASLLRLRAPRPPLSTRDALRLARGIAAGLAALHSSATTAPLQTPSRGGAAAAFATARAGMPHGALSPANVLLETGGTHDAPCVPKLCRYGFTRIWPLLLIGTHEGQDAADEDDDAENAADAQDALHWRAPEQLGAPGAPSSAAADVYALGLICRALVAWMCACSGGGERDACMRALGELGERCCASHACARPDAATLLPALDAALAAAAGEAAEAEARAAQAALDAIESVPVAMRRR